MHQISSLENVVDADGTVSRLLNASADVRGVVDRAVSGFVDIPEPAASGAAAAGRVDHQAVAEAVARATATMPKPAVSPLISIISKPPSSTSTRSGRRYLSTSEIYERRAAAGGQLPAPETFVRGGGGFDIGAIYGHRAAQIAASRGRIDVAAFSQAIETYQAGNDGLDNREPLSAASIYAYRAHNVTMR